VTLAGVYPGRRFRIRSPAGQWFDWQIYLVDGRLYQVIVSTTDPDKFAAAARKFHRSFKLLPAEQPRMLAHASPDSPHTAADPPAASGAMPTPEGLIGSIGITRAKEEMRQRFGNDKVVEVQIFNAGDPTGGLSLTEKLKTMVDPGAEPHLYYYPGGTLRVVLAPVSDLAAFRARIDFGEVLAANEAQRLVVVRIGRSASSGPTDGLPPGVGPGGPGGPDGPFGPMGPFGPHGSFGPRGPMGRGGQDGGPAQPLTPQPPRMTP
jgi:hypothetical protein